MRPTGLALAALLLGVAVAAGQQPVPPAGGGAPPPAGNPPAPAADPKLDAHLAKWEKAMTELQNFRFVLGLTRTDPVFKSDKKYSGVILCMKPNYAVVRLDNDGDKTKKDYEAYICDGKTVFEYNGLAKKITRWPLPDPKANPAAGTDNIMLDFVNGMKAKDAKARFELSVFKEDPEGNYIYLDVKPLLGRDKEQFQQLRMALYGPSTRVPYLPAQVYLVKPDGTSEMWKLTEPQTNIPGLKPEHFAAQKVDGFDVVDGKMPAAAGPAGGVPQPKLPDGGAVRPTRP